MTTNSEISTSSPVIWIVSTGTEILQGLYPDTNAQWISQRMVEMGLPVSRHMALPDQNDQLRAELSQAVGRCDLIIMTGGLGPTADDLNRQAIATVYGVDLFEDERSLVEIEEKFAARGRPMPPGNELQALFPRGARILPNDWGTAPGFLLAPAEGSPARASLLALPGPPREMRPMFTQLAVPLLLDRFAGGRRRLRCMTLHTAGLPESHINDRIKDLFGCDDRVNVALLAGRWRVDVRLTLQGMDDDENKALSKEWRGLIRERLGEENVWGEDDTEFEQAIGDLLRERRQTLATAESCTGGLIAEKLTSFAGSSDFFIEGFVTYHNDAKIGRLGVSPELLREFGAVSAETAEAMARGAKETAGVDWAVSVTGIAGPGGGSTEKPVGTVWLGMATPNGHVKSKRLTGPAMDRTAVRELAAVTAMDWLRRAILRNL